MTFWEVLWKFVFLAGAVLFVLVSIWVAIAGWGDIRRMFAALGKKKRR